MAQQVAYRKDLDTGIEIIDKQHRKFFQLANRFLGRAAEAEKPGALDEAFDFLRRYVVVHFGTEEELMADCRYGLYPRHKTAHHHFRKDIDELRGRFDAGEVEAVSARLANLVVDWFVNHIKTEDRQLAAFLSAEAARNRKLGARLKALVKTFFSD